MYPRPVGMAGQRRADHGRAKVGTADADIHHIVDPAVALALGEIDKPRELAARGAGLVALRHMQDRPVFGAVDPLACEQRRDAGLETRLGRQVQKQTDRPVAKFLARDVHSQIAMLTDQTTRTPGIGKKIAKVDIAEGGGLVTESGGGVC